MTVSRWFNRRSKIVGSSVLAISVLVVGLFVLRRPPKTAMERFVPASALAFIEVDSLPDLLDGLTSTKAWRELAPVLGLSSQLKQVGLAADLIGRSAIGPDEAVVIGRAQYAVAITDIESSAGETDEGPYIHLKPRFALIIETHLAPETAAGLVHDRAPLIAERIFGGDVSRETQTHLDSELQVFRGPGAGRQLVAASLGSVMLIANQTEAIKSCLDSIAGRVSSLADDVPLKQMRGEVGADSCVFGYVTASGIQKLVELSPLLISRDVSDSETAALVAELVEHVSKQAVVGAVYSLEFKGGEVEEEYLTALEPRVAQAVAASLKPAVGASFKSLPLVPRNAESLTIMVLDGPGDLPERALKQLTPTLDLVAGVALREFVINFRKQYGLEPGDSLAGATGSETALVSFGDAEPRAMLIQALDKTKLDAAARRYLTRKGASITSERHESSEILVSSNDDRRAAAFVEDFLVLGTRDQILQIIQTATNHDGMNGDGRLKQVLSTLPPSTSIISYRSRVDDSANLLLAISKLTRVTDGSREILETDSARKAIDKFPRSTILTEFRSSGILVKKHSAVGNLEWLGALVSN